MLRAVDPESGANVDAQFDDTFTYRLPSTKIAGPDLIQLCNHTGLRSLVA